MGNLVTVDGGVKWSTLGYLESKWLMGPEWCEGKGSQCPRSSIGRQGPPCSPGEISRAIGCRPGADQGSDRSIVVWPAAEFSAYSERLNEASRSDARVRAYLRVLFSSASDEIPDRQGRITVPTSLREYAGLDRDVIVVGNGTTAEIWDSTWESYLGSQEDGFSGIDEEVIPGVM